jgi:formylglycine-generating enzyme required for sulfatase activity/tRNA A-37 threonylcarbamoyl transferase component Bud32
MNRENWDVIQQKFAEAAALSPDQRKRWLSNLQSNNPALAEEISSLLDSLDSSEDFFENENAAGLARNIDQFVSQLAAESAGDKLPTIHNQTEIDPASRKHSQNQSRNESYLISIIESSEPDLQIVEVLGYGGLGVVFRARQRTLNRDVAVKILFYENPDSRVRARFVRESKIAAQLSHDHIVQVYSVNDSAAIPFLVMELVDGLTLSKLIEFYHQIPPTLAVDLALQIALGLSAAHRKKLIHRDIKPANVLLTAVNSSNGLNGRLNANLAPGDRFRAKIVDFGLAIDTSDSQIHTQDKITAGTPAYMSPEQLFRPETVDQRADIYSLGATLFQMLSGTTPFKGSLMAVMRQIETQDPVRLRKLDERIPKDLESICSKAIQKDRERRYQSIDLLVADLERFKKGEPVEARPITRVELFWNWCKRNQRTAALGAVTVVALLSVLFGSLFFAITVDAKNREILQQQHRTLESQYQQIIHANPGALELALDSIEPSSQSTIVDRLKSFVAAPNEDLNHKVNAAIALTISGHSYADFLIDHLDDIYLSPARCQTLVTALSADSMAPELLIESLHSHTLPREKAIRLILLSCLGHQEEIIKEIDNSRDPNVRTEVIHLFPSWHDRLPRFIEKLAPYQSQRWIWVYCQAIGLIDHRSLTEAEIRTVYDWTRSVYTNTPFHVVKTNCRQTFTRWNLEVPTNGGIPAAADWIQSESGIRMIKFPPVVSTLGQFTPNSIFQGYDKHDVTLTYSHMISENEITIGLFNRFLADFRQNNPDSESALMTWEPEQDTVESDQHPVYNVSWEDAVLFCNWLSKIEGLEPAYQLGKDSLSIQGNDGRIYLIGNWKCDLESNGYRLPTEAEWEIACRGGSQTEFSYGDREDLLSLYAVNSHRKWRKRESTGSLLSNANGLYDTEGNVWEWCNDWYSELGTEELVDPVGPESPTENNILKVFRGGGVGTQQGGTSADSRGRAAPIVRYPNLGFRVARTITSDQTD